MKKIINRVQYLFVLGLISLPFLSKAAGGDALTLENPISTPTIQAFIAQILDVVVTIATPIAIFAIIYSGFLFVKAQGKPAELENAKKVLIGVLIGVMVILGAQILSGVVAGTIESLK
ncbi:hypothetical protein KKH36_04050 [Patescibacteria group bacterium]|nr:hypothetical protein [Patescibacteria group bacterium]